MLHLLICLDKGRKIRLNEWDHKGGRLQCWEAGSPGIRLSEKPSSLSPPPGLEKRGGWSPEGHTTALVSATETDPPRAHDQNLEV